MKKKVWPVKFLQQYLISLRDYCVCPGGQPLVSGLDLSEGEKSVGLGDLLLIFKTMKAQILQAEDNLFLCQPHADAILLGNRTRYVASFMDSECLLAAVTDPR